MAELIKPSDLYSKAVELAARGEFKEAIEILSKCVENNPSINYYRPFIVDIIQNFDEELMAKKITEDDNKLLSNISDPLKQKFSKKYFKGEYIIRKGDKAESFFVIATGMVLITVSGKHGEQPVALNFMGPGEFFGEVACFSPEGIRTANAVVVSKQAVLLEINKNQLEFFIEKHPKFSIKMIGALCKRLSKTTELLTNLVEGGVFTDARDVLSQ